MNKRRWAVLAIACGALTAGCGSWRLAQPRDVRAPPEDVGRLLVQVDSRVAQISDFRVDGGVLRGTFDLAWNQCPLAAHGPVAP